MTKVLLYKKEDCHLCDEAESILEKLRREKKFFLERITLEPNTDLFERFGNKVPVVFINDKLVFEFKLDEQAFLRKLAELE
ncbi:MAG: glutaredoxin family protein [Bacteroidetes bacterium]|nr:glutaredoxin family protein [Bacteroidota bacterium]MCL5738106.1 glutaredoxin family protein [Bacteroidota bacterium]